MAGMIILKTSSLKSIDNARYDEMNPEGDVMVSLLYFIEASMISYKNDLLRDFKRGISELGK
ncbi:MAG: hypothetical protein OEZ35_07510 [Candidatus Bathyarchaeota archaeon]|nr:hypothetical protein [Candidatus Bathyarchaeota archaeon]